MRIDFLERRSRRAAVAIALLLAVASGLGTLRWTIPTGWSEARLRQALAQTSGYRVERVGEAQFSALPWPTIHVSGLSLAKTEQPAERIETALVKARLNVFSWLVGAPRLVELTMFEPRIDLASRADPATTSAGDEALSAAIIDLLGRDRRHDLRLLRLERATLRLGGRTWMSDLTLKLAGGVGSDLRLTASGLQNGQPLAVRAEIAPAGSQERRPLRATVVAQAFTASFVGVLFGARSLDAEGRLDLSIVDGVGIARRLGLSDAHAPLLNGLAASGNARLAWPAIQLRDARIERGQTRLDGSIEASFAGGRIAVAATLDAQRIDATPLVTPLAPAVSAASGGWPRERLALGWLNAGSLDLRLSTGQLVAGPATLENAALSLQLGGGRMDIMLSEGRLRAGSVKARLTVIELPELRLDVRMQGSCERIDLATLASAAGLQRMRGLLSGQLALRASGESVEALVASAEGRIDAVARDGELPGFDLDRLASRPDAAGGGDRRTRFSTMSLQMQVGEGRARIAEGSIVAAGSRAAIEGGIGLASRTIDVTLRPTPANSAARPGDLRFRLEGPWSGPSLAH